jgi:peptide/nickel transport system permease protein
MSRQMLELETVKPRVSEFRRIVRVMFDRPGVVGGTKVPVLFVIVAIFAPWITPHDPYEMDLKAIRQQPSTEHLLSTDELGRDVLSRLIIGSRVSLLVGVVAVGIAGAIGMALGLIAGYFGGWVNTIIMRAIDALLSLPPLILVLALATMLGGGLKNVLVALGIGMMPMYCRLMCGQILTIKETDYVIAADVIGARDWRIMISHLLPNAFPPLFVLLTSNIGITILIEASLSFLGIGIMPPMPTWGGMVSEGYKYLLTNPLLSFAPGLAILFVVVSINMVGDGLRDALDPRLRGAL